MHWYQGVPYDVEMGGARQLGALRPWSDLLLWGGPERHNAWFCWLLSRNGEDGHRISISMIASHCIRGHFDPDWNRGTWQWYFIHVVKCCGLIIVRNVFDSLHCTQVLPLATSYVPRKCACPSKHAERPWSFVYERVPQKIFVATVGQLRKPRTVTRPLLRIVKPMQHGPVLQKHIRVVLAI